MSHTQGLFRDLLESESTHRQGYSNVYSQVQWDSFCFNQYKHAQNIAFPSSHSPFSSFIYLILAPTYKGDHVIFVCVWFISLNISSFSSTHFAANDRTPFFIITIFHYIQIYIFFIHSSDIRQFGWFHFSIITSIPHFLLK